MRIDVVHSSAIDCWLNRTKTRQDEEEEEHSLKRRFVFLIAQLNDDGTVEEKVGNPLRISSNSILSLRFPRKSVAFAIDNDFVLDPKTICANWTRLWSSFGFTTHQWTSRANKVEEYTKVNS